MHVSLGGDNAARVPLTCLQAVGVLPKEAPPWPAPREAAARLAAGDVDGAVALAWQRLRSADLPLPAHPRTPPALPGLDGQRLLAALAVPLRDKALRALAVHLLPRLIATDNA